MKRDVDLREKKKENELEPSIFDSEDNAGNSRSMRVFSMYDSSIFGGKDRRQRV